MVDSRFVRVRRGQRRGLSLIEILVVVSILAMLATGIAVSAMRVAEDARLRTAKTQALSLRQAALGVLALGDVSDCPTVKGMIASRLVDEASKQDDPWGSPWNIQCPDGRVVVRSAGPDKVIATKDDVVVPP